MALIEPCADRNHCGVVDEMSAEEERRSMVAREARSVGVVGWMVGE